MDIHEAYQISQTLDSSKDQSLSINEFKAALMTYNDMEEEDLIKKTFKLLDINGDG